MTQWHSVTLLISQLTSVENNLWTLDHGKDTILVAAAQDRLTKGNYGCWTGSVNSSAHWPFQRPMVRHELSYEAILHMKILFEVFWYLVSTGALGSNTIS